MLASVFLTRWGAGAGIWVARVCAAGRSGAWAPAGEDAGPCVPEAPAPASPQSSCPGRGRRCSGPRRAGGGTSPRGAGRCVRGTPHGRDSAFLVFIFPPRNPMRRLYHDYFYFHFYNWPTPKKRYGCYICYQVEGTRNHSRMPLLRGVFENEVRAPLTLLKGRSRAG